MSDKERLEIIKDKLYQMHALSSFDIKWLVERAKKYQALVISDDVHKQYIRDLQEENKRLREALETILDYVHITLSIPKEVVELIEITLEK